MHRTAHPRRTLGLLAITLLLSACSVPGPKNVSPAPCIPDADEDRQVVEWLASAAMPIKSLKAGDGFADLEPLKEALEGVRIVGMGEATHGTHEFFTMRHRLVEFLVMEMGYTVFAMEAPYARGLELDRYLQTGEGTPHSLVQGLLYWPWYTQEVVEMVQWMRQYNEGVPAAQRIRFVGVDIQEARHTASRLERFIDKVEDGFLSEERLFIREIGSLTMQPFTAPVDAAEHAARAERMARLRGIEAYLVEHEGRFAGLTETEEARNTIHLVRSLIGYYDTFYLATSFVEGQVARDRHMAAMLAATVPPDTRIMLWGHSAHVAAITKPFDPPLVLLGQNLRAAYGDQYYALGLTFNEGSFNARGDNGGKLEAFRVGPAAQGSVEWYFACAGLGSAMVNLREAAGSPISTWVETEHLHYWIGAVFDGNPNYYLNQALPTIFDGVIYIPETTPTRLLFK